MIYIFGVLVQHGPIYKLSFHGLFTATGWKGVPSSLRQPHSSPSVTDLPVHASTTSSHSVKPLSPFVSPSLFHSRLKTYLSHLPM